jgi:hypothetical protein
MQERAVTVPELAEHDPGRRLGTNLQRVPKLTRIGPDSP